MTAGPTAADFQRWLSRVEWRPGWQLAVACEDVAFYDAPRLVALRVVGSVPDTRTRQVFQIAHMHQIPAELVNTADLFYRWVLDRLQAVDAHECAEWFRVAGVQVADPHDPAGTYTGRLVPDLLPPAALK